MNSTITLYYNCLIEKDKNFILDNNGVKAIETYLQTLTSKTITDFQYIKQGLSLSIKIDASQIGLCMGENCDDLNYVKIQNGTQNPCYYFIISKTWKSANTIELVLSMDTLNTYQYDGDYEISPKTLIKRMHKDRFKKLTGSFELINVFTLLGVEYNIDHVELAYAHGTIKTMSATSSNPNIEVTLSEVVKSGLTYIRIHIKSLKSSLSITDIIVTYEVNGYENIIDLKSEEINAPVYKINDYTLYDQKGTSMIDWSLYYKTADDQATTPVDCYLIPSEAITFYYQQGSGEFDNNNVPEDKYLLFFVDYNDPPITFNIDGISYTPSMTKNPYMNATVIKAIAIFNDNGTLKVYQGDFNNYLGYNGKWTLVGDNPSHIYVENSPEDVNSHQADSLPSASTIFNDHLYLSAYASHTTNMGSLVETTMYGDNSIDKTLSTNIKIINIPYSPTSFSVDSNGIFTFDSCWTYNSGDGKLKLTDFSKRFSNIIQTDYPNVIGKFISSINEDISNDISRNLLDPKLLHSDYYRPKFVYDSFTKIFPLEQIDFDLSDKSLYFNFNFIMSRNIVSKFLFKFEQFAYKFSKEDYENIVAVSRNNEEVLYNSQYLDYIRTGYNYDLKAKEKTEVASGIGIGLNVAGLLASIGVGAMTGSPIAIGSAVASGIGLVSQLVGYAKTTAQNEENIQKKLQETQMQAISVLNADDYDLLYAYSQNKAKICEYEVSPRMKKVLDDLFFYCGYVINEQGKPNVNTRRSFNFVQASLMINHTNNLPNEIVDDIKEKFEQGVTFLHYSFNKFDFNQDKENIERSIL